jgi:PAS domain S-box-containing protein
VARSRPLEGAEVPGLIEAIRHVPAAVAVFDASGAVLHANEQARALAERTLGAPVTAALGEETEIFHLDRRPYTPAERPVTRSLAMGERVVDEEYVQVRPDGGSVTMRCSCSPVYGEDGAAVAAVLVMFDVSGEKHAGERLATFEHLLASTDDAIVGTDADFRLTIWSAGAEHLYGYDAGEILGRHASEVASDRVDERRAELDRRLLEDDRVQGELTVRRKDGTTVEVDITALAIRDDSGALIGYLGVHRDITDRRRAEDERRAAQRRIETILETITDAFVAVDRDWRYTYVNDLALGRMRKQLGPGLRREDVLGARMWELCPEIVGTEFHTRYQEAMREGRPVQFEALAVTGEWIEARAHPSDAGLSIHYRDVGDRKSAEAESRVRAQQQAIVAALGMRALGEADPQAIMDEAVAAVARALGVELTCVVEILAGREKLLLSAGVGWKDGIVGHATARVGAASLVGYTALVGRPVVSEDLAADPRFTISPFLADYEPVGAVSVVIGGRTAPIGVLGAFTLQARRFSEDDVSFMQAVANVISAAFETAGTETRFREVREAERRRIARDLHDEALQRLAIALAEATRRAPHEDELVGMLKGIGQQLRGAIYDLRLEEDEDRPLAARLRALVDVQAAMPGNARFELDVAEPIPDLADHRGSEILRIVGEALNNARRHSGAARIGVRAAVADDTLCIEVADDGHGFDLGAEPPVAASSGLRGMRERAFLVGAELELLSTPGRGTSVQLELGLGAQATVAQPVRILLVEDHMVVREAIAAAFEAEPGFTVVGQAGTLAQARGMLAGVDVALLDLGLPDGFGPELIKELRHRSPRAEALVLSAALDPASLAHAVECGAAGVIDKVVGLGEVVGAVRRLRAGETLLATSEVMEIVRHERRRREEEAADRRLVERLTPRELEVLQALAEGLDSRATADRLHITVRTQRNHIANILSKLDVHSQLQALVFCVRYGVVEIR